LQETEKSKESSGSEKAPGKGIIETLESLSSGRKKAGPSGGKASPVVLIDHRGKHRKAQRSQELTGEIGVTGSGVTPSMDGEKGTGQARRPERGPQQKKKKKSPQIAP